MQFVNNDRCFLCGSQNPHGIAIEFSQQGDKTCLTGCVPWYFQGFQGVVHGGIVASLLDEAMSHSVKAAGEMAVTGTLEVRFLKPCRTEQPFQASASITRKKSRTIETTGELIQNNTIVAEGKAVFVRSTSFPAEKE